MTFIINTNPPSECAEGFGIVQASFELFDREGGIGEIHWEHHGPSLVCQRGTRSQGRDRPGESVGLQREYHTWFIRFSLMDAVSPRDGLRGGADDDDEFSSGVKAGGHSAVQLGMACAGVDDQFGLIGAHPSRGTS